MGRYAPIFSLVPWGDVAPSDLQEQRPEIMADVRGQRLYGLTVHGQIVPRLGTLAIRTRINGYTVIPMGLSIPDGIDLSAFEVALADPVLHANPIRAQDEWDADCV